MSLTVRKFSPQDVPNAPGVYLFRGAAGEVIYVGKAKSLRRRMSGYFHPSRRRSADPKLRALVNSIASYEIIRTRTESEAFLTEERLIKQYNPHYNISLRDDKRYLLVTLNPVEAYPRLGTARFQRTDRRRYWGPVPHATAVRDLIRLLSEECGLRSCSGDCRDPEVQKHCLARALGRCCAPCRGDVTPEEYRDRVEKAAAALDGRDRTFPERIGELMQAAAAAHEFEAAARFRDMLACLKELRTPAHLRRLPESVRHPGGVGRGAEAVAALQTALGLTRPPAVMACFDISNIAGCFTVASQAVFRDGAPARQDYRRYRIRTVEGSDDFASMHEVVKRWQLRLREEGAPAPDLLVIDGGAGQVGAALAALQEAGAGDLPVIGLAKRLEEIHRPDAAPLLLDRHSPALRLLQAIRDEAHRFAISYNRLLRQKRLRESVLDEIPGVGPRRRTELLRVFGSLTRLRRATADAIAAAVPGLGRILAETVLARLKRSGEGVLPSSHNSFRSSANGLRQDRSGGGLPGRGCPL